MLAPMSTMNISLPDALKEFVDRQVDERGFGSSSEYVRELIRWDQNRTQLKQLLLAGAESPVAGSLDDGWLEQLRDRARSKTTA